MSAMSDQADANGIKRLSKEGWIPLNSKWPWDGFFVSRDKNYIILKHSIPNLVLGGHQNYEAKIPISVLKDLIK